MALRSGRWLSLAALLPLLAFAISAPLLAMYCRMSGAVAISSCCCPSNGGDAQASEPTIGAQPCCSVQKQDPERPASERPSPPTVSFELVEQVLPAFALPPAPRPSAPPLDGAPPPPRPPLRLLKSAFLI